MRVKLYTDGGVRTGGVHGPTGGRSGPGSIGFVVRNMDDTVIRRGGMFIGETTVNEAEYSALITGLYNARLMGATEVEAYSDSQLIVNQMRGTWACREKRLQEFKAEAEIEVAQFDVVEFTWIPREKNQLADSLTREHAVDKQENTDVRSV